MLGRMHEGPVFRCMPGSRLAGVGPKWELVPLRIPTGWGVRWNTIVARARGAMEVEFNDSEDLFWAVKLPAPGSKEYSPDPTSLWREIHVDGGWYRDRFRIVMLDPDWDHVARSYETDSAEEFVRALEEWLVQIANDGAVKA
jgi:hypothetical protein